MIRDNTMHRRMLIEELEVFLDVRQAELLETLGRLGDLRAAVIRRDEASLTRLLEEVQQDAEHRRQMETAQRAIERRLCDAFEGLETPVTVSCVCRRIDDTLQAPLRRKQTLLLETARRVQNELEATDMLLRECARCNRELLAAILGRDRQSLTYDTQGRNQWDVQRGLFSAKF